VAEAAEFLWSVEEEEEMLQHFLSDWKVEMVFQTEAILLPHLRLHHPWDHHLVMEVDGRYP